jgi:hypothetical protein
MDNSFTVKQAHLRKAPKSIEVSIGSMGLQLFGAKGKPLESHLYENMSSWQVEPSGFFVCVGADQKKLSFGTDEGSEIVRRITIAAREIGKQYLIDKKGGKSSSSPLRHASAELEQHARATEESRPVAAATDWLNARYGPATVTGVIQALRNAEYEEDDWLEELQIMATDGTLADIVDAHHRVTAAVEDSLPAGVQDAAEPANTPSRHRRQPSLEGLDDVALMDLGEDELVQPSPATQWATKASEVRRGLEC